jgi:uncharacterized caspase-like protein
MFTRFSWLAGIAAILIAGTIATASAQSNIALVIGNSRYQYAQPLHTTIADAAAIAETMRAAGYDVIAANEVRQSDIGLVMRNFLDKLAAAGSNAVGFFYYAGYAAQSDGENYLIPVDAPINGAADVPAQAFRLGELITALSGTQAGARVMVLDASYVHGFGSGSAQPVPPGLAVMAPPAGMMIASAAAPGEVAAEATGTYSLYTYTLSSLMRQPGPDLDQIFKTTRVQVNQATAGRQTPWMVSALMTDVTLFEAPAPQTAVAPPAASPPQAEKEHPKKEQAEREHPKKEKERRAESTHRRAARTRSSGSEAPAASSAPPSIPLSIGVGAGGLSIGIGQ